MPRRTSPHAPLALALCALAILAGCGRPAPTVPLPTATATPEATATAIPPPPTATAIPAVPPAARGYVPILCYHQVRDWTEEDAEADRPYIMPPADLAAQLAYLREQGYRGVSAAQVHAYYAAGQPLPPKPVMLSFDDNDATHFAAARPLLREYGFTATFFIMTVTVGKEGYMSEEELVQLDREGFDIQPHSWDHHPATTYATAEDWEQQVVAPRRYLEALLGHPTPFFAYPFGLYDAAAAAGLREHGYLAAFRLREALDPAADPLFAIERRIANPYWTHAQFLAALAGTD